MATLNSEQIINIAKSRGGFFTVDRYTYRQQKLRKKIISMGKDPSCCLNFYEATKRQLIFKIKRNEEL